MVRSTLADALRFHEAGNREDRKKAAIDCKRRPQATFLMTGVGE
jgi:hypothetical protein